MLAHMGVGIGALVSALYPVSIPVETSLVKNLINQFKTLTGNKMWVGVVQMQAAKIAVEVAIVNRMLGMVRQKSMQIA